MASRLERNGDDRWRCRLRRLSGTKEDGGAAERQSLGYFHGRRCYGAAGPSLLPTKNGF